MRQRGSNGASFQSKEQFFSGNIMLKLVQITPIANMETSNAPPSLSMIVQDRDSAGLKFGLGSTPSRQGDGA
jgi:hypothetical protein